MAYIPTVNMLMKKPATGTSNSEADPYITQAMDLIDALIDRVVIHNGDILTYDGSIVTVDYL